MHRNRLLEHRVGSAHAEENPPVSVCPPICILDAHSRFGDIATAPNIHQLQLESTVCVLQVRSTAPACEPEGADPITKCCNLKFLSQISSFRCNAQTGDIAGEISALSHGFVWVLASQGRHRSCCSFERSKYILSGEVTVLRATHISWLH